MLFLFDQNLQQTNGVEIIICLIVRNIIITYIGVSQLYHDGYKNKLLYIAFNGNWCISRFVQR